jgi:hypothetical protein
MRGLFSLAVMVAIILACLVPVAAQTYDSDVLNCPSTISVAVDHVTECPCCGCADVEVTEVFSVNSPSTLTGYETEGLWDLAGAVAPSDLLMNNTINAGKCANIDYEVRVWHPNVGVTINGESRDGHLSPHYDGATKLARLGIGKRPCPVG